MKIKFKLIVLWISLFLSGCASVQSTSVSNIITSGKSKIIQAYVDGIGILHLTTPELLILPELSSQCKGGTVHGIQTKLILRDLLLIQQYEMHATALCK
ncbi:MAG: hypothetical protein HOO06_11005 [Bdellovibrionaceae bacterium]|nr:hypothetical protein [Pseudobdellovibrionaceae bacterium]